MLPARHGDGKSDVLWRNDDGLIAIWQMDGSRIAAADPVMTLSNDWHIVDVGDYDGNGKSDILFRNDNGSTMEWQMDGSHIQTVATVQPPVNTEWTVVRDHFDLM